MISKHILLRFPVNASLKVFAVQYALLCESAASSHTQPLTTAQPGHLPGLVEMSQTYVTKRRFDTAVTPR